jgi:hypothetical protein
VCGRLPRSDGTFADGRHRKLHLEPCEAWGRKARLGDETREAPLLARAAGIELGDATIAAIVAALGSGRRPVTLDRARIDRQIRDPVILGGGTPFFSTSCSELEKPADEDEDDED